MDIRSRPIVVRLVAMLRPPREKGDECMACRFASPVVVDPDAFIECRRFPPLLLVQEDGVHCAFPQVEGDGWCGEYQREE